MAPTFSFDVFLSHNRRDKPRVRRLAERLRDAGLEVCLDDWVLRPGDDILLGIERGLEASRTLVLCMSPATFGSDWVNLERSTVLFRDPSNHGRRFIPLLLADCDLPDSLKRFKYVDYRQGRKAFQELLEACRPPAAEVSPERPPALGRSEKIGSLPAAEIGDEKAQPREILAVLERTLKGHRGWVNSVAFSRDGTWVASGSDDRTVRLWDLKAGSCTATLKGHRDEVRAVAITPDGKRVVSASRDDTIRVWEVRTGRLLATWEDQVLVSSLRITRDSRRAIYARAEGLGIWELPSGRCLQEWDIHPGSVVDGVDVTSDERRAISAAWDRTLKVWDLENGNCLVTLKGHRHWVRSVSLTPDGTRAVSGSEDKTVRLWDLETGACVRSWRYQRAIHAVAVSPDGCLVASTEIGDELRLWDLHSGKSLGVVLSPDDADFISLAFSPDGTRLVAGGANPSRVFVYRLARPIAP